MTGLFRLWLREVAGRVFRWVPWFVMVIICVLQATVAYADGNKNLASVWAIMGYLLLRLETRKEP